MHFGRHWQVHFLSAVLAVNLIGCASWGVYNTATGRREFIVIPTDVEVDMGRDLHQQIISQYPLSKRDTQLKRLQRVGQRLSLISDRQDYQYQFYLVEKNELNAFTTPGGNIYFFTGLMDKLTTDDQIAAVLAHEIGHCAARHTIKKFQAAVGYNIIGGIILSQIAAQEQAARVATMGIDTAMNLVFSAYSRKDEFEADLLGVKYMYLAGYSMNAMVDVLNLLKEESQGPRTPLILRSHPYLEDRIKFVKEEIARAESKYE